MCLESRHVVQAAHQPKPKYILCKTNTRQANLHGWHQHTLARVVNYSDDAWMSFSCRLPRQLMSHVTPSNNIDFGLPNSPIYTCIDRIIISYFSAPFFCFINMKKYYWYPKMFTLKNKITLHANQMCIHSTIRQD